MRKRISEETKQRIKELHAQGLPSTEVARMTGVSYFTARATKMGGAGVYQNMLAKLNGHGSFAKYQREIRRRRTIREPRAEGFSRLLEEELRRLGRNQSWLAKELDVTRQAISDYMHGYYAPEKGVLEKLSGVIRVPYETLQDLLK